MTKAELIEAWQEATGLCGVLLVRHLLGVLDQADAVLFFFSPTRKRLVQCFKNNSLNSFSMFCRKHFQLAPFLFRQAERHLSVFLFFHCTSLFCILYNKLRTTSTPTTLIFDFFGNWGVPKIEHTSLRKVK